MPAIISNQVMAILSDTLLRSVSHISTATPLRAILLAFPIAWAVWRVWRFTIQPLLRPRGPKEIPYLIPFIGSPSIDHSHLFAFFHDADKLINDSRASLKGSNEPFALSIAGIKTYVLTRPQDVAIAYGNTTTLSFDIFVQHLMRSCGTSEKCIEAMFATKEIEEGFPNPHGLPLGRLSRALHIHQLFPGPNFDELSIKFEAAFNERLRWDRISQDAVERQTDAVVLPLLTWVSDILTLAGQDAYFGPRLGEIDGEMHKTFLTFDALGWQVLYQYPRIFSRTMNAAKNQLVVSLETYFSTPQNERTGDAWFVKAEENEMRARGVGTHDIATMMLLVYWGINTNTRKLAFWLLAYIISQDGLTEGIVDECASAFDATGCIDPKKIESCVKLNGAFYEAIRITAFSASVRYIARETTIGNKVLSAGARLMIPYRQLHFDSAVFGNDIQIFNPQRFIKNEGLLKSSAWRPFGGGVTMCPGRYIAKRAVCTFVAMLLHRYEIRTEPGQRVPQAESRKPVLGIMDVTSGSQDMLVRIRQRSYG